MSPILVLAGVGVLAVAAAVTLAVLIIGIHRGDRRHLATRPGRIRTPSRAGFSSASATPAPSRANPQPKRNGRTYEPRQRNHRRHLPVRHCTEYGCRKCAARARWSRRKKWQSRKSQTRRATGRK